jgi:hypothetical protein
MKDAGYTARVCMCLINVLGFEKLDEINLRAYCENNFPRIESKRVLWDDLELIIRTLIKSHRRENGKTKGL